VSRRFRALATDLALPQQRLEFNLGRMFERERDQMTATRAKSLFQLNETDLALLPCKEVTNPHYKRAAPMRLYDIDDLVDACVQKYETWEAFAARRDKRKSVTQARRNAIAANRVQRRADLEQALGQHGLRLRADSRMCAAFVQTGRGIFGESMQEVVEIMREMDFLYTHTNYSGIVDDIREEYREWGEWYDMDEVVDTAKTRAVREWRKAHASSDIGEMNLPLRIRDLF
jgi:hypothetical protein